MAKLPPLRARIKPYDPKQGHTLQGVTLSALGGKRYALNHWYAVTEADAALLRRVTQTGELAERDEVLSEREAAFDVCSEDEARALSSREMRAAIMSESESSTLMTAPDRDSPNDDPLPATPAAGRRVGARKT